MKLYPYLKQQGSKLKIFLTKDTTVANKNWYVWGSFGLAVFGVGISIYTLWVPVQQIQTDIQDLQYSFNEVYNAQTIDTSDLDGGELIEKYYAYLNSADFQNACSLLSLRMCTLYDVSEFTQWVQDKSNYLTVKLRDGERLVKVWYSGQNLENTDSEIWCAETSFQMNYEEEEIKNIWQYSIATRPDGNKEIRRSLCEYAEKSGEDRSSQMGCASEPKFCNTTL